MISTPNVLSIMLVIIGFVIYVWDLRDSFLIRMGTNDDAKTHKMREQPTSPSVARIL